jgi:hypothetical protein
MFDDMPKKSLLRQVFYTLLILAILGVSGYFIYQKYFFKPKEVKSSTDKIINDINHISPATGSPAPTTTVSPN